MRYPLSLPWRGYQVSAQRVLSSTKDFKNPNFLSKYHYTHFQKARAELIADRKTKKEAREAKGKNKPLLSAGTRRRILNLESDDNGDDSDSDFGLMFNAQLPDLDSPSRFVLI